jgi:hypothetical protein
VAPLYPRTLVRYAGTCMVASLEWGRWPGARFPLPKTWGFLVLAVVASPARQPARPSPSPLWPGALGTATCSDTVKRTQSIHPFHPTVTTVTQSRRKRNRFGGFGTFGESRSQRFSLGVPFYLFGDFDSLVTIASCDSAVQVTGASWPAIAFAQTLQCRKLRPKPEK